MKHYKPRSKKYQLGLWFNSFLFLGLVSYNLKTFKLKLLESIINLAHSPLTRKFYIQMPPKHKCEQQALLVQPGDEEKTTVVTIDIHNLSGSILGKGISPETWPYSLTKDVIRGPNGRQYRLEMYVGDSGAIDESESTLVKKTL